MDTKPQVWKVFNVIRYATKDDEEKTIGKLAIKNMIGTIFGRYDDRTHKHYIQCMTDNKWITLKQETAFSRNPKYTIDMEATYDKNQFQNIMQKAQQYYSKPPQTPLNNTHREGERHTDT